MIVAAGRFKALHAAHEATNTIDHRANLVMTGLHDIHLHFLRGQVIASREATRQDWLNDHTYPAETAGADPGHAARIARAFCDRFIAQDTTLAMACCSVDPESVDACFTEATGRIMCRKGGKVMMDRNPPEAKCATAQPGFDDRKTP